MLPKMSGDRRHGETGGEQTEKAQNEDDSCRQRNLAKDCIGQSQQQASHHREDAEKAEHACQHHHQSMHGGKANQVGERLLRSAATTGNSTDEAAFTSSANRTARNRIATRLAMKILQVESGSGTRFR